MNLRVLLGAVPVMLFLAMSRAGFPAWLSISVAFGTSAVVFWVTRKDRLIGVLGAFGLLIACISAVVGVISSSERAYLAAGPVSDLLFAILYVGSVFAGKPLIGGITRELFPQVAARLEPRAPVYVGLTFAWAGLNIAQGTIRTILLLHVDTTEYIIWSRIGTWPMTAILLATSAWLIQRAVARRESPTAWAG